MISIYLIGSLRNNQIPVIGQELRKHGFDVFDDWFAGGRIADDEWQRYEQARGRTYAEALKGYAAKHVFEFDLQHLNRCDISVLVLPAGKSGHLELGHFVGSGKPGYVLFPREYELRKTPEEWKWLAGLYEGEGCLTRNGGIKSHGMQLSITMRDEDIVRRALDVAGVGSIEGPYKRQNPKHSPMWRWSVRRREYVLHVVRGIFNELGIRRRGQIKSVLKEAGLSVSTRGITGGPQELRWDIMYQLATGVFFDLNTMIESLKSLQEAPTKTNIDMTTQNQRRTR